MINDLSDVYSISILCRIYKTLGKNNELLCFSQLIVIIFDGTIFIFKRCKYRTIELDRTPPKTENRMNNFPLPETLIATYV